MNKFGRKKIAFALACASLFGGKIQAMNSRNNNININRTGVGSPQTLGEVGGAANSNSNTIVDWIKNHKITTAAITTGIFGLVGLGLFLGLRSGDKKDDGKKHDDKKDDEQTVEARKQYFEIYKKILNVYLISTEEEEKNKLNEIIKKDENGTSVKDIFALLAMILVFGDFKNNNADVTLSNNKFNVQFNISEDKKILQLCAKKEQVETKETQDRKIIDLKIPEIPQDKAIKFDDNAVRCAILFDLGLKIFNFELKNKELIRDANGDPRPQDWIKYICDTNGMTKDWVHEIKFDSTELLTNDKKAAMYRGFVEVSEDFKTCVLKNIFYADKECKNEVGISKWEFDIAVKKNNKKLDQNSNDQNNKNIELSELKESK